MKAKAELLAELGVMLRDVFAAKAQGKAHGPIARAHGFVDGYMRVLLDLDVATKEELLEVVQAERERAYGPALHSIADFVAA